jgi:general secretion pathway protein L
MAHTICGIDLGAFSIKFVMLEVGFRQTQLRGLLETAVPPGEAPLLERQAEAIRDGLSQISGEATPYLAVPGDILSIRLLELPFTDPRKIDQVVGYELEGQIVHPLEDVVFDHMLVRAGAEGSTVLAVAAKRDDIGLLLAGLESYGKGIAPRALYAAPIVYRALASALPAAPPPSVVGLDDDVVDAEADGERSSCQAILDLGHVRTNLCILRDGQGAFARTITRGGFHLTTAIAQAFDVPYERAEQIKRGEAELGGAGRAEPSAAAVKLDAVLREALAPTVRELRQSLASFRAASKGIVDTLLITGGTGRLRGLSEFLESELGIPARFLPVRSATEMRPRGERPSEDGAATETDESSPYALATAIALTASRGTREIDLRRGPYVYRASFSVLRQKAVHLGLLVAGVVIALVLDVGAALTNLGSDRKDLDQQLKTATQELFGEPRADAREVTQLLRKGFKEELAPIPKATAFDLLDQISRKMPSDDDISLDVMELDIRPKKTFIKGTVDSAAAVDEIGGKLKTIDCFDEVTKGAITEVSGGGKQFTLTIASKCP